MRERRKMPVERYSLKRAQAKENAKKRHSEQRAKGREQAVRGVNPSQCEAHCQKWWRWSEASALERKSR